MLATRECLYTLLPVNLKAGICSEAKGTYEDINLLWYDDLGIRFKDLLNACRDTLILCTK
ncbi:hypothetical protein C0J52_21669 [Blattella germanica]|nr:hypothetical protein C0J52_21669 [Blattella germanica]